MAPPVLPELERPSAAPTLAEMDRVFLAVMISSILVLVSAAGLLVAFSTGSLVEVFYRG